MNGLHELPLVIFTVLAQSVVGAFLLSALVLISAKDKFYRSHVHKAQLLLLALLGIGFIASILHLGSPWRAFNSLNRIGESMLSNEIASGAIFFALFGIYWLLAMLDKMPKALGNLWLIFTAVVGCAFMYMMNQVYHISSVPTWNSSLTSWSFYLTIVLSGFGLGYALFHTERPEGGLLKLVPTAVSIGALFAAIVAIYQGFGLAGIETSVQKASDLVPDFAVLMALRFLCIGLGITLLFYLQHKPQGVISKLLAVVALLAGEMIARTLFYALHMTVGMAVGG